MSILNLIKGEPMPDKNDPKYRERYEKEVQAGRDFAEKTGLTWVSGHITDWACRNKKLSSLPLSSVWCSCALR